MGQLFILNSLTKDEAKSVIDSIIKISEQNPLNNIYILKNNINYNQYQYLLLGQNILYFCDEKGGYLNKNFGCIINSSHEVNTFYDFIKHELIPKHCYNEQESMDFLKSLI